MRGAPIRAAALLLAAAVGCTKSDDAPSSGNEKEPAEPGASAPAETAEAELYDEPVERRLYSDRIEASSFLWNSWNRFRENYHPNYVMDGDPKTAWVEGADGPGEGEWLRAHVSRIEGATELRIRLRNGYHKSESLYEKNARIRELEVVAHPSGASSRHRLDDEMTWHELRMPLKTETLTGVELRALSVYEGSRYEDLVVSDLEIFATGLTVENPAFEKQKLESIERWKRERLAAARAFEGAESLPIAAGYEVAPAPERAEVPEGFEGPHTELRRAAAIAATREAPRRDELAALGERLSGGFEGYVPVRLVAKGAEPVPAVDGIASPRGPELLWGRSDAFLIPATDSFALLDGAAVGAFDLREDLTPAAAMEACREERTAAFRPPGSRDGPHLEELLLVRCVAEETREGTHYGSVIQLLRYDEVGRLTLAAGPQTIALYEWDERTLAAGTRYWTDGRIDTLSRLPAGTP